MGKTTIEWCTDTWNPVRGCSRVSEGCRNCYAEKVAHRFNGPGLAYEGLTTKGKWNGTMRVVEKHMDDPLRWKSPRRIFVNSMSDLFHESLPDEAIFRVLDVMQRAPRHTFQVLTKRPARMLDILGGTSGAGLSAPPLPNVWWGVSVEDQATADERIPLLVQAPAAVRFLSVEPLLSHINLRWLRVHEGNLNALTGVRSDDFERCGVPNETGPAIGWVIVGGESGPGSRPMSATWVRDLRDQCIAAGVPFFFKQWGGVHKKKAGRELDGRYWDEMPHQEAGLEDRAREG